MAHANIKCKKCSKMKKLLAEKDSEIITLKVKIDQLKESIKSLSLENNSSKSSCTQCFTFLQKYVEKKNTSFLNFRNSKNGQSSQECPKNNEKKIDKKDSANDDSVSDYVFDETYKMYYSKSTGYYYEPNSQLWYAPLTGTYFRYDYEKSSYEPVAPPQDTNEEIASEKIVVDGVENLSLEDTSCETNSDSTVTAPTEKVENENLDNVQVHTDNETSSSDWKLPEGSNLTVADLVKEITDSTNDSSDYVYDENSKMYYSHSTGYFYDAVRNLLYDSSSGKYYHYDESTSSYTLYCTVDVNKNTNSENSESKKTRLKARRKYWKNQILAKEKEKKAQLSKSVSKATLNDDYSSPEEGEIMSSDSDDDSESKLNDLSSAKSTLNFPCIRAIVKSSECLQIGSLLLITCTGGTIGRDETCTVHIPDDTVNEVHADVYYCTEVKKYKIRDLGSGSGTFINKKRLSKSKKKSTYFVLSHNDTLSVGSSDLLVHIHWGHETCEGCEPWQILADLNAQEEKPIIPILTKEEKEKERRRLSKKLKMKYGLEGMSYIDTNHRLKPEYEDKAQKRRQTLGSDNPYEKVEASSVHSMISESNKGYQMLKKLGWKKGDPLGANRAGISEPIPFQSHSSKAGLGAPEQSSQPPSASNLDKRTQRWMKAQERYFQLTIGDST